MLSRLRVALSPCAFFARLMSSSSEVLLDGKSLATSISPHPTVIMSGIQPSGIPHVGNYFGFIQPWIHIHKEKVADASFLSIADLHTISAGAQSHTQLHERTLQMAASLMACGAVGLRTSLFRQSAVPEVVQLFWILSSFQTVTKLQRLPQYKDKVQNFKRSGVPLGLLAYPVLQAADILSLRSTHVPVGADQSQHMNLVTDIALTFNTQYDVDFFPIPEKITKDSNSRIRSLRAASQKMSKSESSARGRIDIIEEEQSIREKCREALSDEIREISYNPGKRQAISNLIDLLAAVRGVEVSVLMEEAAAWDTVMLKGQLAEALVQKIAPIREKYREVMEEPKKVEWKLLEAEERVREVVRSTLQEVFRITGFR